MFENLQTLLTDHGYWVVAVAVFLNNLGLPVPGDMTVFGGGFLAQKGMFSVWGVVAVGGAACFMGCNGSYWLGRKYGHSLLMRIPWMRMTPKRTEQMNNFFTHYGPKAVFFARFVALLHPVTGFLAGVVETPIRPFLFYNFAGSIAYALIYAFGGYFLGQKWGAFQTWLGPFALNTVLFVVVIVVLWFLLRHSIHAFFAGLVRKK